jgi:hypothetical protein
MLPAPTTVPESGGPWDIFSALYKMLNNSSRSLTHRHIDTDGPTRQIPRLRDWAKFLQASITTYSVHII